MLFSSYVNRDKREEVARIKDELRSKGCEVLPDKRPEEHFDSNCITPVGINHCEQRQRHIKVICCARYGIILIMPKERV